jgi:hypothetical protein
MKHQVYKFFLVALVTAAHTGLHAAPTSKAAVIVYSQSPFSGNLTRGFLGHDARAICRAIEKTGPKEKAEFETTAQYEARLAGQAKKTLYGTLTMSSTFAFVVPTHESPKFVGSMYPLNLRTKYDADSETMNVEIGFSSMHPRGDEYAEGVRSIIWNEVSRTDGSYLGSNAFGATTRVERTTETTTGLAFDIATTPLYRGKGSLDKIVSESRRTSFHVSPQRAKLLKDGLRILVIATLIDPYTVNTEEYKDPTLEYPYEETRRYRYLKVAIEDVWIFDLTSGEVFVKLSHLDGPEDRGE